MQTVFTRESSSAFSAS